MAQLKRENYFENFTVGVRLDYVIRTYFRTTPLDSKRDDSISNLLELLSKRFNNDIRMDASRISKYVNNHVVPTLDTVRRIFEVIPPGKRTNDEITPEWVLEPHTNIRYKSFLENANKIFRDMENINNLISPYSFIIPENNKIDFRSNFYSLLSDDSITVQLTYDGNPIKELSFSEYESISKIIINHSRDMIKMLANDLE